MAGPVASVLMPSLDGGLIPRDVLVILSAISGKVKNTGPSEFDLQVTDTRAVGGNYRGDGRPFRFQAERADLEEPEQSRIRIEFGVEPIWEFVISAMCNGEDDHRILAEIALHFARACGGVVDFGGALIPPRCRTNPSVWEGAWTTIQPDFDVWIKSFSGKIVGLPYETARGTWWTTHVCDSTFLHAWLQSPDFHMIK
jgi:hypothetical protein